MSLGLLLTIATVPVVAGNNLPLNSELSISLTSFNPYNNDFKVQNDLIDGNILDLNRMPGNFKLPKTGAVLDLTGSTLESDTSILNSDDYSKTFINNTFNTEVESCAACTTVVTDVTSGSADTLLTGTVHGNGTVGTVTYKSDIVWDSNDDGDFTDTGDRSYFPLASTSVVFLVNMKIDGNVTNDAGDYVEIKLNFETAGSDYPVSVRQYFTSGDSGWGTLSTTASVLSYYDTDATSITSIIPLAEVLSDASASITLKGLDDISVIFAIDGANNQIVFESKNIGIFANYPALTDRSDNDNDKDFNDAGNIFANPWDDTNYFQTSITEGATESYDSTMPLLSDLSGNVTLLHNARYLKFTGVASIDPTGTASSPIQVSANKWQTTETLLFNTQQINDFRVEGAFSDVITFTNVLLNVTIDDAVLTDSSTYEDNLVFFSVDGVPLTEDFRSAWSASTVVDDAEIQYDLDDFSSTTGSEQDVVLTYYTLVSWDVSDISATTTIGGAGSGTPTPSSNNDLFIIAIVGLGLLVGVVIYKKRKGKKKRRKK